MLWELSTRAVASASAQRSTPYCCSEPAGKTLACLDNDAAAHYAATCSQRNYELLGYLQPPGVVI